MLMIYVTKSAFLHSTPNNFFNYPTTQQLISHCHKVIAFCNQDLGFNRIYIFLNFNFTAEL